MITIPFWQWVFTAAFAAIAVYLGYRLVVDRRRPVQMVGDVFHILMALVMLAMTWPWWRVLPWTPQLIIFAVSTLWFLGVAVAQWSGRFKPEQVGCHPGWHQFVHAVMMGSMTWMVAVMPPGDHHHHMMMSQSAMWLGYALTAGLIVGALAFVVDAVRNRGHAGHGIPETASMVTMLVGMAVMNITMF